MTFRIAGAEQKDIIIMGGGLAGGLLAYRLRRVKPHLRVLLIEKGKTLGGNHTWSFHSPDLSDDEREWVSPLIAKSWDRYQVHFPAFSRIVGTGYHSISSEKFHEVIAPILGDELLLNCSVKSASEDSIFLEDGRVFQAPCIIDARGFREFKWDQVGYQKFVGLDVTLTHPHGLTFPTIMDAKCPQKDGYRFFYVLPWSEDRMLIEDTQYSNSGSIDVDDLTQEIKNYALINGWKIKTIDREEVGVLPIPMVNDCYVKKAGEEWADQFPCIGARTGLFHPTTGYSILAAVRLVNRIVGLSDEYLKNKYLKEWIEAYAESQQKEWNFFRLLNRMLFLAAPPETRYRVLQRFYKFPENLLSRFYSGTLKFSDYVRILSGRPPVPIHRAIGCLVERKD